MDSLTLKRRAQGPSLQEPELGVGASSEDGVARKCLKVNNVTKDEIYKIMH